MRLNVPSQLVQSLPESPATPSHEPTRAYVACGTVRPHLSTRQCRCNRNPQSCSCTCLHSGSTFPPPPILLPSSCPGEAAPSEPNWKRQAAGDMARRGRGGHAPAGSHNCPCRTPASDTAHLQCWYMSGSTEAAWGPAPHNEAQWPLDTSAALGIARAYRLRHSARSIWRVIPAPPIVTGTLKRPDGHDFRAVRALPGVDHKVLATRLQSAVAHEIKTGDAIGGQLALFPVLPRVEDLDETFVSHGPRVRSCRF